MKALSSINRIRDVCPGNIGICLNVYNPLRTKLELILQLVAESVPRRWLGVDIYLGCYSEPTIAYLNNDRIAKWVRCSQGARFQNFHIQASRRIGLQKDHKDDEGNRENRRRQERKRRR